MTGLSPCLQPPPEQSRERPCATRFRAAARDTSFDIYEYETQGFINGDWESQKRFYPYFQNRGISLQTQRAFSDHFFLATRERGGKTYTNLSFPLSLAAWPGKDIVGLEERSRPNADGKTAYKGMAAGSNAAEGLWIARLENNRSDMGFTRPIDKAKDVYWFESAFDAMAFYQLKMNEPGNVGFHDLSNAVYVSTGGSPTKKQFSSMIEHTPEAIHHLCFDRTVPDVCSQSTSPCKKKEGCSPPTCRRTRSVLLLPT